MKRNDHVVVFAINGMTPRQAARMTASTMVTVKKFAPHARSIMSNEEMPVLALKRGKK